MCLTVLAGIPGLAPVAPLPTGAALLGRVNWQHVIDRCIDTIMHVNYITAMLLISLGILTVLSVALWTIAVIVRSITSRR